MKPDRVALIAVLVLLGVGVAFLGLAGHYYFQAASYLQRVQLTTGTVTDNIPHEYTGMDSYQTYTYYCPMIQFQAQNGANIESESEPACSNLDDPPVYKVGQKVKLYYDLKDPSTFTLKDHNDVYSSVYGSLVIAGLIFLVALLVLWVNSARANARQP